jgi:hypothetical protein
MNEEHKSIMEDLAVAYVEAIREENDRKLAKIQKEVLAIVSEYIPQRHRAIVKEFNQMIFEYIQNSQKI